jgi:hypothetical protein
MSGNTGPCQFISALVHVTPMDAGRATHCTSLMFPSHACTWTNAGIAKCDYCGCGLTLPLEPLDPYVAPHVPVGAIVEFRKPVGARFVDHSEPSTLGVLELQNFWTLPDITPSAGAFLYR